MATLLDLAAWCKNEQAAIAQAASATAVKIAEECLLDFITVNPVDTSRMVSNWVITLGAPATEELGPYVLGKKGSTRDESSAAALTAGLEALRDKVPGIPIYLVNNVPYAKWINEGTPHIDAINFPARAQLIAQTILKG